MPPPPDKSPNKGGSSDFGSDRDAPRRTSTGALNLADLSGVGAPLPKAGEKKASTGQTASSLPQVGDKPRTATGQIQAQGGGEKSTAKGTPLAAPAGHGAAPAAAPGAPGAPGAAPGPAPAPYDPKNPFNLTQHQRAMGKSGFVDTSRDRKIAGMLGTTSGHKLADAEAPQAVETNFDGETPAEDVTSRDLFKAVQPPVVSTEANRSPELYDQVIKQFAVGANPRYAEDAPGKSRGHIFVWDVSRAMGCEIPHFVGARELTLAQTVDWLRHEGPMRGWVRAAEYDVFDGANQGYLVVAVPKDVKLKFLAVVAPQQDESTDGKPLLTGAAKVRGHLKNVMEMFGVRQLEYFSHP